MHYTQPSMPPMLPLMQVRPVDPQWKCQRFGECCTIPREVVMTKQEAAVLVHHAPKEIVMHFRPIDETFVALKAGPCPLYAFQTCLVYDYRPYNCRRFACMRPDPTSEPWEAGGPLGNRNLGDRVLPQSPGYSRAARRLYERIQRKAMGWAHKYGWKTGADHATRQQ